METFLSLLRFEFKRIFSNTVVVAIFFAAPIFYGILFGYVYQQAKVLDLPIVVIDQDSSPLSNTIIDAFDDNETLKIVDIRNSHETIAEEMPSKGYQAIITIPSGFEADILQKRNPEVHIDLNMSNILNANFASKNIQAVLATINAGIEIESLEKQGLSPSDALKAFEPFNITFNKLYNPSGNYDTFMLPGLLGVIMQQIIFLALALVFARDFEDGYFARLVAHSKSSFYHIALKSVPFLILIPFMWLIVASFLPMFGMELNIFNPAMILVATLLSTAAMFIGMLFSILIPSQLKATEFLMVISTPAFVLSGFTWPVSAMPAPIVALAQIIPLTHFLEAFKKIALYGGVIKDVIPELTALFLLTIISFVTIVIALKVKILIQVRRNNP